MVPEPGTPHFIALAGPTACGKTAVALALARALPLEVVSVDSALVYRGMDVGTAKPTPAERAAVPHHLIDIREPSEHYSAAEFVADARRAIAQVHARGALPLLVGGTMLYFKALFEGLAAMPAADPQVRAALEGEARAQGWPALHAELARVDAITASRLAPHDAQRIQRALEVFRVSGRPLSAWHADGGGAGAMQGTPPALLLSLEPRERSWLHQRIALRFEQMLRGGFLDEVRTLRRRPELCAQLPSMRCVGYRQAWEWLDACDSGAAPPLQALEERSVAATRQLAKRQLTWLRAMPQRQVIDCQADDAIAQVLAAVRRCAPGVTP
ncbi:tRNA (adenosine(37)-N6)-dimethylallyltransferase MiaA [Ramlibacter sp. AN1015]|uniref:tRNA (adenosine(37)-N6)-dimethylallyltransferase MiaA n=1 Tax=Ramlibacter sp. AN1015 TaxID=3133428 RepID=UPI0030BB1972